MQGLSINTSGVVDSSKAMTVLDSCSVPPPLIPRRPTARRLETVGMLPRRKVPAVPPPVEGIADPDPVEQNRINEAVWVRRTDIWSSEVEELRPRLPERTRLTATDRTSSAPASHAESSSAGLPFNSSQFVEKPAVSPCFARNRVQNTVELPFNIDHLTFQNYPSSHLLNTPPVSRLNHNGSLTHASDPTIMADKNRSHGGIVTLQHWPKNRRMQASLVTLPRWPESRSSGGVVTLPRWPIATASPDRNSESVFMELPVAGIADLHLERTDNEYVTCPMLGLPVKVQSGSVGSEVLLPQDRAPALVTLVKPSDAEKKLSMLRNVDEQNADCQSSSGPLVCPKCAGCRCKSCVEADRKVKSAIEFCSCAGPVRYLRRTRKEGLDVQDCKQERNNNDRIRERRCRHVALGMLVAALCLPCLCCYWPLKAGHKAVSACRRRFTGQLGVCRCPPDIVNADLV